MRAKTVGGGCAPDRSLAPVQVHHGRGRGLDVLHVWKTGDSVEGAAGRPLGCGGTWRRPRVGIGGRGAACGAGRSLGVERRDDDWAHGVRDDELVARSVEVDAGRELFEPLGYGEGKGSERDVRSGLAAETGA